MRVPPRPRSLLASFRSLFPGLSRTPALAPAFACLSMLAACVVVPVTQTRWDPQCRQVTRHVTLEPVQLGAIANCANRGCEALVIAGAVSVAASTIVSGSIAIVGNVAYWAEERGGCRPPEAASAPGLPAAPAAGDDGLDPSPAPTPRRVTRPSPDALPPG